MPVNLLPGAVPIFAVLLLAPFVGWAISNRAWYALGFLVFVVIGALGVLSPMAAFGAYAFLVPFESVTLVADTGGATITKLVGIAAAGALLANAIVRRRFVRPPPVALAVAALFVWVLASFAWAVDLERSQSQLVTAISLVAMYVAAISFQASETQLRRVCVLTAIGGVLAAAAIVMFGFEADAAGVARGTLSLGEREANANAAAQSLLLPLTLAVAALVSTRSALVRLAGIGGIAIIASGIFLTVSRSSLAAIALMFCLLLYRFRVRWQVLVAVGILGLLVPLMPGVFFDRIGNVFSGEDATGSGRTLIWGVGLDALPQYGIFGAGFANFPVVYNIFSHTTNARGAHNEYLGTWVDLGVIGLVLFVVALVGHLRLGKWTGSATLRPAAAAAQAACLGFLFIAFFSDVLWRKAFWIPWILAIWLSRLPTTSTSRSTDG